MSVLQAPHNVMRKLLNFRDNPKDGETFIFMNVFRLEYRGSGWWHIHCIVDKVTYSEISHMNRSEMTAFLHGWIVGLRYTTQEDGVRRGFLTVYSEAV